MNTTHISAEMPPVVATWMRATASPETWQRVGRDLAVALGTRLLANDGEAGWNRPVHVALLRDPSPAIRAVAAKLGCDPHGRRWSTDAVTKALRAHFEDWSGYRFLSTRLGRSAKIAEAA